MKRSSNPGRHWLACGFAAQPAAGAGHHAGIRRLELLARDRFRTTSSKFEAANPGIKVKVTDYAWPDYHDSLILRIRGNTPTDVVYGGQDWLPAWGAAGFIAPLDSVAPRRHGRRAVKRHRRLRADRRDL